MKNSIHQQKQEIDMLNGSLGDKIIFFALPIAATGILEQLFNAADTAVIGQFVGKNAMAAVGSNSSIIALLVGAFTGIALGTNVVIANFIGGGHSKQIGMAVDTSVVMALICGFGMTVLGELAAAPFLGLMSLPAEVYGMAVLYLRIYLLGMPVIFLYNFESAIFRASGDSKTPLICLVISGLINVGLNLFFVLVVKMTVDGVALATVISNLISSVLLFILLLHKHDSPVKMSLHKPDFSSVILKRILQIGLPAGLQNMIFSISNICVQSAINSLGADIMAASSAAFNIEVTAYYLVNGFGQACTTFTSQNYGAGQLSRCRRVLKLSLIQDCLFTLAFSSLILIFGTPLLRLFNNDPTVLEYGKIRLLFILVPELINVLIEIFSGAMRGYGNSLAPALIALLGVCGVRIIWVYAVFPHYKSFATLLFCYPLSWVVTAVGVIVAYGVMIKGIDKEKKSSRKVL